MSIFQLHMYLQQQSTMPLDEAFGHVRWRRYFRQFEDGQPVPPESIKAYQAFQRKCEERRRRDAKDQT
jgi:hypothetical protein